jgi:UDP-glucuronate decarboxylase
VRGLVDKGGNPVFAIQEIIAAGVAILQSGSRLVVGCDYGISRSNAIAAGILTKISGRRFGECLRDVLARTDGAEIKLEMIDVVRSAVESSPIQKQGTRATLVTGAGGFLGSAVVQLLSEAGIRVVTPARAELDILRDRAKLALLMSEADVECVVHLANPRVYTSNLALGETLTMLRNVVEACTRNDANLVYPSGWEVYSAYRTRGLLVDEATPLHAKGPYGDTKVMAEGLIERFRQSEGLSCILLRLGPVYGVGSERPKFMHTFIEKAVRGENISTHRYRNGRSALDLVHISDAAQAIVSAVSARATGNFNIGTGVLTEIRTIGEWMLRYANRDPHIEEIEIDDDMACIALDASLALRVLGWRPTRNLAEEMRTLFRHRESQF